MKKFLRPYLAFLMMGSLIATTGCGDDDNPNPSSDRELITTVELNMDSEKGGLVSATFSDMDGIGGDAPEVDQLILKPNTTYTANLTLLNENESPVIEIHEEVFEERDDHQVFYVTSSALNLTVTATDTDTEGRPLGLQTTFTTGDPSTGTLKVVLKHQPGTKASAPGDITKGETDVEAEFEVLLQQ